MQLNKAGCADSTARHRDVTLAYRLGGRRQDDGQTSALCLLPRKQRVMCLFSSALVVWRALAWRTRATLAKTAGRRQTSGRRHMGLGGAGSVFRLVAQT